jgi:hypothetical protein
MGTSAEWHRHHTLVPSDKVIGRPVHRPDGHRLGIIDRLMIDKLSGQVAYAVLSHGGLLGFGEKHCPVPWSELKFNPLLDLYELDRSLEELDRAGSDANFDWGDRPAERRPLQKTPYV